LIPGKILSTSDDISVKVFGFDIRKSVRIRFNVELVQVGCLLIYILEDVLRDTGIGRDMVVTIFILDDPYLLCSWSTFDLDSCGRRWDEFAVVADRLYLADNFFGRGNTIVELCEILKDGYTAEKP
jgi:hypothetical protein